MVGLSDARMSGTSYGICALHTSPESALGGPLCLVRDGDIIEFDVAARRLHLDVHEAEFIRRRAEWQPPAPKATRGYGKLFRKEITQAHEGCDFRFLHRGDKMTEPEIY